MTEPEEAAGERPVRRAYDNSGRERAAAERRARIVAAAADSFTTVGWTRTTVAGVAAAADVSEELVVKRLGRKPDLLLAALQAATFESDADLARSVRDLGLDAMSDAAQRVETIVTWSVDVLARLAPYVPVLRAAADHDPVCAALLRRIHDDRRRMAEHLAASLRGGPATDEQADELTVVTSPEVYLVWTRDVGVGPERYADWLRARLRDVAGLDAPA